MAHDHGEHPPNDDIRSAVKKANESRIPLVICADANSHHIVWGSSDTNTRGESLFSFILNSSLEVVNRGSEPTFIVSNRSEVLDLTLVSAEHHSMINNWAVSDDCSFSDHLYIDFNISVTYRNDNTILNRRKTNWELQSDVLSRSLPNPPTIENRDDIEVAVEALTEAFQSATNLACKPNICRGRNKPPWWNPEIAHARRACRKLFNEAKRLGNWPEYKSSVNHFKNLTRNAKRKAWRDFCSGVEGSSETNRLRKILSTSPVVPSYIQKPCGRWTLNSKETLEVLLDTHFPGCLPVDDETMNGAADSVAPGDNSVPINRDRIQWAIKSFDPFKSPGPDGIIPADLQKNEEIVLSELGMTAPNRSMHDAFNQELQCEKQYDCDALK
ncbi:uncharacterized protein LOC135959717 [Calliphora vicina]|uniref:uncharacterized protein LOC135959717 n=1 Tax=Calliphora vicina TaxID=7373 RepID=UPI00325A9BA8